MRGRLKSDPRADKEGGYGVTSRTLGWIKDIFDLLKFAMYWALGIAVVVMLAHILARDATKIATCRAACHPSAFKNIDNVCHCATEDGWIKPKWPSEVENEEN